jgi:hypothetical protein
MKKLILSAAISALALTVAACGDNDAADEADTTVVDTADTAGTDAAAGGAGAAGGMAAEDPNWPRGTRIVEEGGKTYRVAADNTRTEITDGSWRVVTEGGERFRVDAAGTRHRIDDDGLDVDLPAVDGVDVDLGTNQKGNLDLDVSTDGDDASNDRGGDR